jgi:hypothetical protein
MDHICRRFTVLLGTSSDVEELHVDPEQESEDEDDQISGGVETILNSAVATAGTGSRLSGMTSQSAEYSFFGSENGIAEEESSEDTSA